MNKDSITAVVNSAILCAHFSSIMRRPIVLHICLAFCSLLLLNGATQCLAFPKMERREMAHGHEKRGQSERINVDDLENNSIASKDTPQPVVSKEPMIVLLEPLAMALNNASPINEETHSRGAGLLQPHGPGVDTVTEPGVPAGEEVFGSSQLERTSESLLSKAIASNPITTTAAQSIEKEEHFSSTNTQPIVEGLTEATQGFLKYVGNQLFTTESQGGISLGHSPSSYVNTKKILATNPRTETLEADTDHRTTSFPGAEPIAGTEPGGLMSDREKPSQMTADNTQPTATKHGLATAEYTLSVEPGTDSLLGAPEVTVSVSTAVPDASVLSDEWDDTKLEHVSQIKTLKPGDNTETQMRMETSPTAQVSDNGVEGMEGDGPLTEAAQMGLGLPEGETRTETALLIARGDGTPAAFTDHISFTPTSSLEDTKVSVVNLFENTVDFMESTKENNAMFFSATTVSISEYESEAYQPLRNTFKDAISQEMTTAAPEAEATLSLATQEQQVSPLQLSREDGDTEEGKESPAATSDVPGVSQLSRTWEPLATTVSTTAVPLSFEATTTVEDLMDTVTGPSEELFTPVLGSPVTPPGITEEAPSISPALSDPEASSEAGTIVPSVGHVNIATPNGLDQLESEEEPRSRCKFPPGSISEQDTSIPACICLS
ncbi:PREDICTED: uncharacterized protein C14orf37 homolog isoform X5 [Miniopterus natalensis]|uniref:uncharacterized protein C14orf37 homolog isoform X5 n=1 Tax=Miniopterus natalensis TaxID=291302 RepID=UPI0007A726FD|nr:PREDICTED: uncharacterized protein C14orf37 homolog isoform X5 [Miniopterus natalensis]